MAGITVNVTIVDLCTPAQPNKKPKRISIVDLCSPSIPLENYQAKCPICFKSLIENSPACLTGCGHVFCFDCIRKEIKEHRCPVCLVSSVSIVNLVFKGGYITDKDEDDVFVVEEAVPFIDLSCSSSTDSGRQFSSQSTNYFATSKCPLCWRSPLKNQPSCLINCGHVFCLSCIEVLVGSKRKCPECVKPKHASGFYVRLLF